MPFELTAFKTMAPAEVIIVATTEKITDCLQIITVCNTAEFLSIVSLIAATVK